MQESLSRPPDRGGIPHPVGPGPRVGPDVAAGPRRASLSRIDSLDGIRGIASLYVTVHHLANYLGLGQTPFSYGPAAVMVFFVLSGFVLMLPICRAGGSIGDWKTFALKRTIRIIPPYYASIALTLVLIPFIPPEAEFSRVSTPVTGMDILSHLALIHNLRGYWYFKINSVFWSIAFEWQFYILLPIVIVPLWRLAGSPLVCLFWFGLAAAPWLFPLQHTIAFNAGIFGLGIAAVGVATGEERRGPVVASVGACLAMMLLPTFQGSPTYAGVGVASALLFFWLARHPEAMVSRALRSSPLRRLGAISYSLYLVHAPICAWLVGYSERWPLRPSTRAALVIALGLAASLGMAGVFYRLFERPSLDLIRRLKHLGRAGKPRGDDPQVAATDEQAR